MYEGHNYDVNYLLTVIPMLSDSGIALAKIAEKTLEIHLFHFIELSVFFSGN